MGAVNPRHTVYEPGRIVEVGTTGPVSACWLTALADAHLVPAASAG
jgi:hypothetical protein